MDHEMETLAEILARVMVLEKRMATAEQNLLRVAEVINAIIAAASKSPENVVDSDPDFPENGSSAYL